ncbi:hypothetical protein [Streptomyces sp. NPDC023588]|uniref:hypothetical protein n=1 Tax=Streptomyces sp. NPDC023588 TaxID=3154907 RepID=UPI0033F00822
MTTPAASGLFRLAFDGFSQARGRLTECLSTSTSAWAVSIPAIEAVYWGRSLDEQLIDADAAYTTVRGRSEADVMRGLKWIRNRASHSLPLTVRKAGGLGFPLRMPLTIEPVTVLWLHGDQLPPEPPQHIDPKGRAAYNKTFADRPVTDPLDGITRWFANERSRPGSLLRDI